jgi:hypothetical protein
MKLSQPPPALSRATPSPATAAIMSWFWHFVSWSSIQHIEGLTGTAHNGATKFYELEEEKAFLLVQFFWDLDGYLLDFLFAESEVCLLFIRHVPQGKI